MSTEEAPLLSAHTCNIEYWYRKWDQRGHDWYIKRTERSYRRTKTVAVWRTAPISLCLLLKYIIYRKSDFYEVGFLQEIRIYFNDPFPILLLRICRHSNQENGGRWKLEGKTGAVCLVTKKWHIRCYKILRFLIIKYIYPRLRCSVSGGFRTE